MGKPIFAVLHEKGQQTGLFCRRRLREEAKPSGLGICGHEDLYYRAAEHAPAGWRRHVHRAIEEADAAGHPVAADLRDVLARHGREPDLDAEGGDRAATESRWVRRLMGLPSLMEARRRAASARMWLRRLRG